MLKLDRVQNIETLRQVAIILERENLKLVDKVVALQRELLELKGADPAALQMKLVELEQQLAVVRKKVYGDSSEKRPHPDADAKLDGKRGRGHGPREQKELPIVEEIHELDDADKICNACGGDLLEWNKQFEESEEVDFIGRSFFIRKHRRQKYRCACHAHVETALGPPKLIPGGRYSVEVAVLIAMQKYVHHIPLERQVRMFRHEGLVIDSQTLWDQINALARVLLPAYERLAGYVLAQPIIGADETRWRLLNGADDTKKSWQVWAVASPDAVHYKILDSRSVGAAREVLGGYLGVVMADGYGVYESLARSEGGFVVAHCWAHVRRKFVEIEDFFPTQATEILAMISALYDIERCCPTGPPGDALRAELRGSQSRAIIKKIQDWLLSTRALPQSSLGKAIAYARGMWVGLTRFLDDARIPLDNNATERAMRGPVIGRKNHHGSKSRRGTEVAALLYTLMESAKLNRIDPAKYLSGATWCGLRGEQIPLPHELIAMAEASSRA